MPALPLTRGHESFHNRLERIARSHLGQVAGERASKSVCKSPVGIRGSARADHKCDVRPKTKTVAQRLSHVSRLNFWSFVCLIGGGLTLGKTIFGNAGASHGFAGFSAELLYSVIWVVDLFLFFVGLLSMRQKPSLAQFSVALGATMFLGLM